MIDKIAKIMYYVNGTAVPCWRGSITLLFNNTISNQFTDYTYWLYVWVFNVGYIWTDISMLSVATPSNTESTYPFFVAFYLGDLLFRLIFKSELDVNCWYPWNNCLTAAELDLQRQKEIEALEELTNS